jgi:Ca-activated chloride channel family protein
MRRDRDLWMSTAWFAAGLAGAAAAAWAAAERYTWANPEALWLGLLLLPPAILRLRRERRRGSNARLSTLTRQLPRRYSIRAALKPLPFAASLCGTGLLIAALARPQSHDSSESIHREGIDIVLAMDVSASMLAKDLRPDRLEASKRVALDFIDGRPNDRIGLVVYEGEAFTQCPLTTDHRVLKELFSGARSGLMEGGTAVGLGLATALNRLRESTAKSKVVILLTDGVNNTGTVQPLDAALMAENLKVRVYTIGVGTRGKALTPVARYPNGEYRFDYVDVDLDEPTLEQIARTTGGRYFRATDERKLKDIYQEIDRLEKTRIEVEQFDYRVEEYRGLAMWGALLLLGAWFIDRSIMHGLA